MNTSPSTVHPELLPSIGQARRITKSIAVLDVIVCPEWESRYYSYNSKWGTGEEMASMRDGCGNEWFLLFDHFGAALKGFAHESGCARDSSFPACILESVPAGFTSFLRDPAFSLNMATFCLWRRNTDSVWNVVAPKSGRVLLEDDGSEELLCILDGNPKTYHAWAEDYYERPIALEAVQAIYGHRTLSESLIAALNSEISLAEISTDLLEIGYPSDSPTPTAADT